MAEAPPVAPPSEESKRQEVEAILASECFRRAPRLHQFLAYVCAKSLRGEADDLKEYSIAVEALGRPPDFDQTKDAIVRVEAHRLRKRLELYYETEGAHRPMRLSLPVGGYVPAFEPVARAAPAASDSAAVSQAAETELPDACVRPGPRTRRFWIAAGSLAALAPAAWLAAGRAGRWSASAEALPAPAAGEIRIAAGLAGGSFVDPFGRVWQAAAGFEGGRMEAVESPEVGRTWSPQLYRSRRVGEFSATIPVDDGVYELALLFAESDAEAASGRTFDVSVNGRSWLESFHVASDAGGLFVETIKKLRDVRPADGAIRLEFRRREGQPLLNGVEIAPGTPGRMRPVRILAGRIRSYHHERDRGRWDADRYFEGGTDVLRANRVAGAENPNLFAGERYGSFRYVVPVVEGVFRARLLFAETWFGASNPGRGGEGSRLFDIRCNGRPLIENFDPLAAAGGENSPTTLEFEGLRPNPRGKLEFEFVPRRNYAMVNAIEIEEMGR